jgi:hypothetical protein
MYSLIQGRKIVAILVIVSFSTLSIISAPARAAMVDTDEILKQSQYDLSSWSSTANIYHITHNRHSGLYRCLFFRKK